MISASLPTKSKLFTVPQETSPYLTLMKSSTFSFLVDTLYEEIMMHPHKDELLTLMDAQVADDT